MNKAKTGKDREWEVGVSEVRESGCRKMETTVLNNNKKKENKTMNIKMATNSQLSIIESK